MSDIKVGNIVLVNPVDQSWTNHRYILWFGAYGTRRLMVWANGLDSALDKCVDWLVENAPGLLRDEAVEENYKEALADGKSEEEAQEYAEQDMTCAGNFGNYIASWEWGIVAEDPTREDMKAIIGEAY